MNLGADEGALTKACVMSDYEYQPSDGLHVRIDIANPREPFVTSCRHRYINKITSMELSVPSGFRCDFASFPRVLWWIFPRVGRYSRAALFHDYAYRKQEIGRFHADSIFWRMLENDGVPRWQRFAFFVALRLFGNKAWEKNKC